MNTLKSALSSQQQAPPGYLSAEAFHGVLQNLASANYDSEQILGILNGFFLDHRLFARDFPQLTNSYSRTLVLKQDSGLEILIVRWEAESVTPVHGHPDYSFMYVIEGQLSEQLYIKDEKRLLKISSLDYYPGDYSYHKGDSGRFDNSIHRLSAVKNSLSLHVYSDDALKGEVYKTI